MVKKRAHRNRMIYFLFLFFFLILVILYVQSPYSKIEEIRVSGNERLSAEEIVGKSGLKVGHSIFLLPSQVEERMEKDPEIKRAKLVFLFPNRYLLEVEENQVVALLREGGEIRPVLENGYLLSADEKVGRDYPILTDWKERNELPSFIGEVKKIKKEVLEQISEIRSVPTQKDRYKVVVYMKDQFEVETSLVHFSQYMNLYPFVKEGLTGKKPGVITMNDSGSYYISYEELQMENQAKSQVGETGKDGSNQ